MLFSPFFTDVQSKVKKTTDHCLKTLYKIYYPRSINQNGPPQNCYLAC